MLLMSDVKSGELNDPKRLFIDRFFVGYLDYSPGN